MNMSTAAPREPALLPGGDRAAYDQLLANLTEAVRPSDFPFAQARSGRSLRR